MEFKINTDIKIKIEREKGVEKEIYNLILYTAENEVSIDCFELNYKQRKVLSNLNSLTFKLLRINWDFRFNFYVYVELLKQCGLIKGKGFKTHWVPEGAVRIYFINKSGKIGDRNYPHFLNTNIDDVNNYNVFPDESLAKRAVNVSKLGRLILLWQYNNNCLYTPDVKDKKNRYTIKFSSIQDKLVCVEVSYTQGDLVCFETEEECEDFIEMYKDEIKELWGIGDDY